MTLKIRLFGLDFFTFMVFFSKKKLESIAIFQEIGRFV